MPSPNDRNELDDILAQPAAPETNELDAILAPKRTNAQSAPPPAEKMGLWESFIKGHRPEAQDTTSAAIKTFCYLGGLTGDALAEATRRLKTGFQEGLGADEWKNALRGHATPMTEHLKSGGLPGAVAIPLGLAIQGATDPMAGFGIGGRMGGNPIGPGTLIEEAIARPANRPVLEALLQSGKNNPIGAVSSGLYGLGKRVYKAPWKKADAALMEYNNNPHGEDGYSNYLWNEGEPLVGGFSKSNPEMADQVRAARKEPWNRMSNVLDGDVPPVDLAPEATQARTEAGESAVERLKGFLRSRAATNTYKRGINEGLSEEEAAQRAIQNDAALQEKMKTSTNFAGYANRKARMPSEDAATAAMRDRFKAGITGEANQRTAVANRLKEIAPEFSGLIDENMTRFKTGGSKEATEWFHQFIDDILEGPRSLDDLHSLGSKYGQQASGSSQLASNIYKGGRPSDKKFNQAGSRKAIEQIVEDKIESGLNKKEAGLGSQALQDYLKAKSDYSVTRRGEKAALQTLKQAEGRQVLTKADLMGAGYAITHPHMIPFWLAAKTNQVLGYSPRIATGTGMLLNDLSKTNIWDNMLRQGLLNQERQ